MAEQHAERIRDLIDQEVRQEVLQKGRPLWTRVGIRFRNNEMCVLVTSAQAKPGLGRSFAGGFLEQDWVYHP